ncbi:MAG TPA: hypothetical protein PKW66_07300, partial [Polyangiaceae bacterium]|nr:hypothetical protein [Polyangiaceae bacterium]
MAFFSSPKSWLPGLMAVVVATPVTMVTPEASASPTPNTADASLPPALRNYPGVTRIEHHDGKIRVEVSQ